MPPGRRSPFLAALERLRDFQRSRSRLPAPHAADPGESELGNWLHAQTALARQCRMEPLHGLLLEEALGPDWGEGAAPEMQTRQA